MKILPYICFFISVAGFFVLKSPIGKNLDILGGFLLLFCFLMFFLGAISLIFSRTSSFSFDLTLPHHFYFRLPLIYLITIPFLFFNPNVLSKQVSIVGYLFAFWFNPTRGITELFSVRIYSFPIILALNLFFWFLAGLLIDKIINKFKKSNA